MDAVKTQMTVKEFMELPESNLPTELMDGELIMSPTPKPNHQTTVGSAHFYLKKTARHGQWFVAPLDVHFDKVNIVQPDIFWVSGAESKCQISPEDGYHHGAPDLVIEVLSPGTEGKDRGKKFNLYQRYGVREYWLVNIEAKLVEVFRLENEKFLRVGAFEQGEKFVSVVLGNLEIDVEALLNS
jgi:Uma2 family endonuclease